MDFPTYIALYNYVVSKSYPRDATESLKATIRGKAKKFLASKGQLFEIRWGEDECAYYGRQLLHEGTMDAAIIKVHNEGHLGENNTWSKVHLQFLVYDRSGSYLTKWPIALAVKEITAEITAKFIQDEIVAVYGAPSPSDH
ncbi:hypothetical protein BD770DRAFT_415449 [Pilaira anomala]|nr:hypothetical protein BD770DRAFT_415449 [Pilaira anomala]